MPLDMRSYFSYVTSLRGVAFAEPEAAAVFFAAGVGGAIASSMSVLNFPQSGHLPSHFGEVYPHSEHTNYVVALGMGASYAFTGIKSTVAYTVMPLPSPT